MLLFRSIFLEVCLVLAVSLVSAQYDYEGEAEEGEGEGEEAADFTEGESEGPDYANYYSEDTSAPVSAQEGSENAEFAGEIADFFPSSPIIYGESNKKDTKVPSTKFVPKDKQQQPSQKSYATEKQAFPDYHSSALKDFFKEAERNARQLDEQASENSERPGPSYVSHQVPYKSEDDEEDKSESPSEDVERIAPKKNKPKKYGKDGYSGEDTKNYEEVYTYTPFPFETVKNSKQPVNYDIGKSSSTVSQYNAEPSYNNEEETSPYDKHHFNPSKEGYKVANSEIIDALLGTPDAYKKSNYKVKDESSEEPQSTEDVPSKLKGKGCRRVDSPDSTESMNCFICENPDTKSKYTECSYTSKPEATNFYEGTSEKFSLPHKSSSSPSNYRYKRYTDEQDEEDNDPYTIVKARSQKAYEESDPPEYSFDFNYEPEHYDETKPEVSYSEEQAEELKKNPENCKEVEREGMTCTVCSNPKTGGNFEQCSYTSAPTEKKYAYVTEKKFDRDQPEETQDSPQVKSSEQTEETKEKASEKVSPPSSAENLDSTTKKYEPASSEKFEQTSAEKFEPSSSEKDVPASAEVYEKAASERYEPLEHYAGRVEQTNKRPSKRSDDTQDFFEAKASERRAVRDDSYDVPSHFIDLSVYSEPKYLDSSAESAENVGSKEKQPYSDFDEYHYKLFPELAKQESRVDDVKEYQIPAATKQNVEEVLAQFSKKDRSNCKKAEKNGMTCYLCVDQNSIQQEECMFVQESRPQSSHVAYHQVKAVKDPKKNAQSAESQAVPAVAIIDPNQQLLTLVPAAEPLEMLASASEDVGTYAFYKPYKKQAKKGKKNLKKKRSHQKNKKNLKNKKKHNKELNTAASEQDPDRINDKTDPTIKTPAEFIVRADEGAFSEETRPVYSKALGIKLPKYMLQRSEFEKEFDDFSSAF